MDEMSNKTYAMAALAVGGLAVIAAFLAQNALLALLAAALVLLSVMLWKMGYILLPMLTGRLGIVENRDPYEIPPARDMVIKKSGSRNSLRVTVPDWNASGVACSRMPSFLAAVAGFMVWSGIRQGYRPVA